MIGSANLKTYLLTVATATPTDVFAALRTLHAAGDYKISKLQIRAQDQALAYKLSDSSAGASAAAPAAGVAAVGYMDYLATEVAVVDLIVTGGPIFITHAGGVDKVFDVMVWR